MASLIIDCDRLIRAVMDMHHATARQLWHVELGEPTEAGFVPAAVVPGPGDIDPHLFLQPEWRRPWQWGEPGKGTGPGGTWDHLDEQDVEDYIEAGLLEQVELAGQAYLVLCTGAWLTTGDFAREVGAHHSTITKWARAGWLPHAERYGRDWYIPARDLLCWHKRKPGPKGPRADTHN